MALSLVSMHPFLLAFIELDSSHSAAPLAGDRLRCGEVVVCKRSWGDSSEQLPEPYILGGLLSRIGRMETQEVRRGCVLDRI